MWHDPGKWVTCRRFSILRFLHHFLAELWAIYQCWKQRNLNSIFANISKTISVTSNSFPLIMSHICYWNRFCLISYPLVKSRLFSSNDQKGQVSKSTNYLITLTAPRAKKCSSRGGDKMHQVRLCHQAHLQKGPPNHCPAQRQSLPWHPGARGWCARGPQIESRGNYPFAFCPNFKIDEKCSIQGD